MKALLQLAVMALSLSMATLSFAAREADDDEQLIDDARVQHRSYEFPGTGESIPYAVFVPSSYDSSQSAPLIVALHGFSRTHDWLMGYHGFLDEAEANGYIVATPLGYIRRGWYGSRETADKLDGQRSEQDVMNVLQLMQDEFNIDSNRIYLWGHSMGGAGTYHIASENPELFAAIGVVAPAPEPDAPIDAILNNIKHLPTFVLHGDEDSVIPVDLTRTWVGKMKELGMQHVYVEIPGGDHSLLISQNAENMKKVVDFFNIVRKQY